jgi:serine/threonine protein kinase
VELIYILCLNSDWVLNLLICLQGVLLDGEQVAMKCLRMDISSNFNDDQFQNEVGIMGRIFHKNIVELKGYCIHTKTGFLVHEFVINGSLAAILFGNTLNSITKQKRNESIKHILGHYKKCKLLKWFLKIHV